jgi:hypothetical protein
MEEFSDFIETAVSAVLFCAAVTMLLMLAAALIA